MLKRDLENRVKELEAQVVRLEAANKAAGRAIVKDWYSGQEFVAVPLSKVEEDAILPHIGDLVNDQWSGDRGTFQMTVHDWRYNLLPQYTHYRVEATYTENEGVLVGKVWGLISVLLEGRKK